jgi:arylsulfatase A-like enzyme
LVISNPRLFPAPASTDALYSHVDLMPTIAALTGAEPQGVGVSHLPVITGVAESVQDEVLFTFDDSFLLELDAPVSHLRVMRTPRWTYGVYYSVDGSGFEYELYDNDADPNQMVNLVADPASATPAEWPELHDRLTRLMQAKRATPEGFDWALATPPIPSA